MQAQVAIVSDYDQRGGAYPSAGSSTATSDTPFAGDEPFEVQNMQGESILMNVYKDQTGEMVAYQQIDAVVVQARFRNYAERNGKVDVAFNIIVPPSMRDPEWQLRFRPQFRMSGDTIDAEEVLITGTQYRAAQLRGYELYRKFLSGIIPDTADFVNSYTRFNLLNIFIERNFPSLAALRSDSTFADSTACSLFGISERQAIEHYTKNWLVERNNRRNGKKEKMYNKYVKSPLLTEGIRLDSVINNSDGTVTYNYVQTIKTKKNLRKVEMVMDGNIYAVGRSIYTMPQTEPLTFYISSISTFADKRPRYIRRVINRNAEANMAAYIDFTAGKYNIDETLSDNAREIGLIKENIVTILSNPEYLVDSLIITASCSPEGSFTTNRVLAQKRAESIKKYFSRFIGHYRDSVRNSVWNISLADDIATDTVADVQEMIKTRFIPEDWERLERLILADTAINRAVIERCLEIEEPDMRERALVATPDYKYIRSVIYPQLRRVKFDFHLHRKGMIKDTIRTTVIDTVYMNGVRALEERDYKAAVTLLRPYNDFNSAVAFVCMDYNQSALSLLETLPKSAGRDYMLAIVYARLGDGRKAVQYFIHSVEQESTMRHRGNLDPEISELIKKYAINDILENIN